MRPRTIDDLGGDWRLSGSQLNYRRCPECDSQNWKLYVDPASGLWHCFRCDAGGRVEVPRDADVMRARLLARPSTRVEWGPAAMPPNVSIGASAEMFLWEKYGMSGEMVKLYGLVEGYLVPGFPPMPYVGRVLIPYCDRLGEVVYFSGRSYVGAEPKYRNMPGRHPLYVPGWIAGDAFLRAELPGGLVLVEGAFDAIKVHIAAGSDVDVVALGGKSLPRYLLHELLKLRPRRVRVALDSDAFAATIKLRAQLAPFVDQVDVVQLPEGEDPGSMSFEAIREALL